jgi:hypothetical protein
MHKNDDRGGIHSSALAKRRVKRAADVPLAYEV